MLAAARCAGESKKAPSQVPYKFQKFFSYFNSTSVNFLEGNADIRSCAHTVGAQPGSQAMLGADWIRVSEAGAHRPHMALPGPSANDNLLVQCWWECGLARPTTFQTFPRERSSCDRPGSNTNISAFNTFPAHPTAASRCGWERKRQTIGGKQRGMRLGGTPLENSLIIESAPQA